MLSFMHVYTLSHMKSTVSWYTRIPEYPNKIPDTLVESSNKEKYKGLPERASSYITS